MEKYLGDLAVLMVVLLICAVVWDQKKIKPIVKFLIAGGLLLGTLIFVAQHHHLGMFTPTAVVEGAKETGKGFVSKILWVRIFLAGLVGALTYWYAKKVGMLKPWLYDRASVPVEPATSVGKAKSESAASKAKSALPGRRDNGAYWATNVCGYGFALAILLASKWSLLPLALAALSEVAIMNVQVPEQERWTPVRFGKRCFGHIGNEWMLGNYCFENGFHWMLLPRNWPGLSFNVVEPHQGINLACKTGKIPTKGFKVGKVDVVGGEVEVEFMLLYNSHVDLEAYYSSQEAIRNDPAKLAAYAAEIFAPQFRSLLKGKDLTEIQTGEVFDGQDFEDSQKIFERGTGHEVTLVKVKDPTPSEEVQKQINALAAKEIEKVQAGIEAEIEATKKGGVGKGRLAELEHLAEALRDPDKGASIREALAAVRSMDFAAHSNLRVLVERELGPLAPLVAEASED